MYSIDKILILVIIFIFLGLAGEYSGKIIEKIKIPSLIGMMLVGMFVGPSYLNLIPDNAIKLAPSIKDLALVTVLFIGGLGISSNQIKLIGRPAILLSILPAVLEGFTIAYLAQLLLGFDFIQGAILGFIIAAVSPAVLIPSMVSLIERRIGEKKSIPQMLLVGASADDTVAITFFTTFLTIYLQSGLRTGVEVVQEKFYNDPYFIKSLATIPIAIILAVFIGFAFYKILEKINDIYTKIRGRESRYSVSIVSFFLALFLRWIEKKYHLEIFNSLLTVMSFGFFIRNRLKGESAVFLKNMNFIWKFGKIYLFIFVGMAINPKLISHYFYIGLLILCISLTIRSIGVYISLIGTNLNFKEKIFCIIAYLPKATVQSAKAGIPLEMGVAGGEIMQAVAILSVLVTAPLGAIGIKMTSEKFLSKEE